MLQNEFLIAFILLAITILVAWTASLRVGFWRKFYTIVPPMILLYLLPSLLGSFHIIKGGDTETGKFALSTLLPLSLLLLTMTINLKTILLLSRQSLVLFFAGTLGIVIGGPIALYLMGQFSSDLLTDQGANSVWKGLVCISGSWINGTPGQTSMKEIFGVSNELFFVMVAVDTAVQNIWLALLFLGVRYSPRIDRYLEANLTSIREISIAGFNENQTQEPPLTKSNFFSKRYQKAFIKMASVCTLSLLLIGFLTAISQDFFTKQAIPESSNWVFLTKSAFWQVFYATTLGIVLSFTKARQFDKIGATKIGNFLLFFIFSTIGLKMNLFKLGGQWAFITICVIWLIIHFVILMAVAKILKAPFFFVAVGSQANIGGPATASILASAFNPHLASVGVLLGVLSNIIGNYCGLIAGMLFKVVAN
jgi:uncharacterized membrane protein